MRIHLSCPACGETASADPGDYWDLPDSYIFRSACDEVMTLATADGTTISAGASMAAIRRWAALAPAEQLVIVRTAQTANAVEALRANGWTCLPPFAPVPPEPEGRLTLDCPACGWMADAADYDRIADPASVQACPACGQALSLVLSGETTVFAAVTGNQVAAWLKMSYEARANAARFAQEDHDGQ